MHDSLPESNDPKTLLKWYISMGVDEAILSSPQDRFALSESALANKDSIKKPSESNSLKPTQTQPKAPQPITARTIEAIATTEDAKKIAANCNTLDTLKKALENFDGCSLKQRASHTVFADGIEGAPVMVIGDAPNAESDKQGKAFLGADGALLDKMLAAINLSREENVYITNLVPWRPLGNSRPDDATVALCLPFLLRHIALAQPKYIFVMGGLVQNALFQDERNISKVRGTWQSLEIEGAHFPVLTTYQPMYLLQQPRFKADAWSDLLSLKAKMLEQ